MRTKGFRVNGNMPGGRPGLVDGPMDRVLDAQAPQEADSVEYITTSRQEVEELVDRL